MAVLTILVSILLIVPTAYWIRLRLPKLRPVVEFITMMPFVMPAIVLVFGMIRVYGGGLLPLTNFRAGTKILLVAATSSWRCPTCIVRWIPGCGRLTCAP